MPRLWTIILILYGIALTVATHWPRLDLGRDEHARSPDKVLHFIAFGALALILSRTRWFRRKRTLLLVALAWTTLDELSQMVPVIDRIASWSDWIAGAAGVLTAVAWLWALEPLGGPPNRLRLARSRCAADRVLGAVPSLARIVIGGAIGAIGGLLVVVLSRQIGNSPQIDIALLTALAGAGAGAYWAYALVHRRAVETINQHHACFACAKPIEHPSCNADGVGKCGSCGAAFHIGQWLPGVQPSDAAPKRMLLRPVLLTFSLVAVGALLFLLVIRLWAVVPAVSRTLRAVELNMPELVLVIDVAYLLVAVAIGVRLFRRSLAAVYDEQDKRCVACKHDLRATPAELGIGTCGECGTRFVRVGTAEWPQEGTDGDKWGNPRSSDAEEVD